MVGGEASEFRFFVSLFSDAVKTFPAFLGSNWVGMAFTLLGAGVPQALDVIQSPTGFWGGLKSTAQNPRLWRSAKISLGILAFFFAGNFFQHVYDSYRQVKAESEALKAKLTVPSATVICPSPTPPPRSSQARPTDQSGQTVKDFGLGVVVKIEDLANQFNFDWESVKMLRSTPMPDGKPRDLTMEERFYGKLALAWATGPKKDVEKLRVELAKRSLRDSSIDSDLNFLDMRPDPRLLRDLAQKFRALLALVPEGRNEQSPVVIHSGGVASIGQQGGQTAGTIINNAPPMRHLTPAQKDGLAVLATTIKSLEVYCYNTDPEGCNYASEFWAAFKKAGIDVGVMVGQNFGVPVDSAVYLAFRDNAKVPAELPIAEKVFSENDIHPRRLTVRGTQIAEGAIEVWIGRSQN